MKLLNYAVFIVLLLVMGKSYGQLQISAGPAVFLSAEKESDRHSVDYTIALAYQIEKFDVGLEFIQNGYRGEGRPRGEYHFYQYQAFGRYFPLKKRTVFLKAGTNISEELSYRKLQNFGTDSFSEVTENGTLFGLEGGLGFQDRLLKKTDLFVNVSLTYNHLFLIKDDYFYDYKKEPTPFYALKMSLVYLIDFSR